MASFKKTSFMFMVALGLLGAAACGDDDKDTDSDKDPVGGNNTSGNNDGDDNDAGTGGDNGGGGQCVGGYAGFTGQQIKDAIVDPAGACANDADIEGVCKLSPSDRARDVGIPCFFSVSGNANLTDEQKAEQTGDCALNGKGTQEGLKTILKGMGEECITCYVDAVVCAAQKCSGPCGTGTPAECEACRDEKECTSAFFTCSGLPTGDQLGAGQ